MDTKILNLNKLFINISQKFCSKNNDKSADNKSNSKYTKLLINKIYINNNINI